MKRIFPAFLAVIILCCSLAFALPAHADTVINGTWLFNESLEYITSLSFNLDVDFTVDGVSYNFLQISKKSSDASVSVLYLNTSDGGSSLSAYSSSGGWVSDAYRTIDFGDNGFAASDEFVTWFYSNASVVNDFDYQPGWYTAKDNFVPPDTSVIGSSFFDNIVVSLYLEDYLNSYSSILGTLNGIPINYAIFGIPDGIYLASPLSYDFSTFTICFGEFPMFGEDPFSGQILFFPKYIYFGGFGDVPSPAFYTWLYANFDYVGEELPVEDEGGFYDSIYDLISGAFYGKDAELDGWQEMILTVIATFCVVLMFAIPFIILFFVIRLFLRF